MYRIVSCRIAANKYRENVLLAFSPVIFGR